MTPAELRRSGIYKITNTVNSKMYVGSSINIYTRWIEHKRVLKNKKKKHNRKLQYAWNKYGGQAFEFFVIEFVEDKTKLIEREQYWIDTLDAVKKGYNTRFIADRNLGLKASVETCQKMSCSSRKYHDAREAAGIKHHSKGRKAPPEEIEKAKTARAAGKAIKKELGIPHHNTGRKTTPEENSKRSASLLAMNAAKRENGIPLANVGRKQTPEHVENVKKALAKVNFARKELGIPYPLKGKKQSPKTSAKRKATMDATTAYNLKKWDSSLQHWA